MTTYSDDVRKVRNMAEALTTLYKNEYEDLVDAHYAICDDQVQAAWKKYIKMSNKLTYLREAALVMEEVCEEWERHCHGR